MTTEPIDNSKPIEEVPNIDSAITTPIANPKKGRWGKVFGAVSGVAGSVGNAVGGAASAVSGSMVVAGDSISNAAGAVGGAVGALSKTVGGAVVGGISTATSSTGQAIDAIGNNFLVKKVAQTFKADWLLQILDRVDVSKAEAEVKRLQKKYPYDSANQIAQKIIKQKSVFAGATGFASSIVPGAAAIFFAGDLIATTTLQAEMVYQIASAYGMDLQDSTRKGEVAAVFGLAFGGKMAIKAGLGMLRNIPVAGSVIAVSSNAVMLYTLGQASCAFYEAKLNPVDFEEQIEAIQKDSEEILKSAIPQEEIIDRILAHVILAGNQGKNKEEILNDLRAANLKSEAIVSIASYIDAPMLLENLLNDIKPELALFLCAQCQKFAMLDGIVTPEEAKLIKTIEQKLEKIS
ncbi:MAG: hypothetical protein DCF19_10170 [Pseudanabaena frigida]|uniref:EcsC family protein n=1 Tax=Pseudanabaena frigida TaxID=945775 RepID=A0A2W4Y0M9_9CYAN|nr:MAG: hypothetical protein DCF19_10170 [Pseudanabaena frigida]